MTTLDTIRTKVRRLTSRPSAQQITDDQIDEYINTFYLYDMPEEIRLFSLRTQFEFMTIPNQGEYDLTQMQVQFGSGTASVANVYYNLTPPAYVAGYQVLWAQDPSQFYAIYPKLQQVITTLVGDGTPGPYAFTLPNSPVLQNNCTIGAVDDTGATIQAIDSPVSPALGNWVIINTSTPVTGSIQYLDGTGTITFANNIPAGNQITIGVVPYVASRPQAMMYFDNSLVVRPVPNAPYLVQMVAYKIPTALLEDGSSPELNQWWQYLAYGAAKKIFEDTQDPESVNVIMPEFKVQEALVLRRTIVQNTVERAATIYTEQASMQNWWGGYGWWF